MVCCGPFRGAGVGHVLVKLADDLCLKDLLEALEGTNLFERCVFWPQHCAASNLCLIHFAWSKVKDPLARDHEANDPPRPGFRGEPSKAEGDLNE